MPCGLNEKSRGEPELTGEISRLLGTANPSNRSSWPTHVASRKLVRPRKPATKRVRGRASRPDCRSVPGSPHSHGYSVAGHHRLRLVVGDVHGRVPELVMQAADLEPHFLPQVRIQVGKRFIQQQDFRIDYDCSGERHALLLTARELGGIAFGKWRQLDDIQDAPKPLPNHFAFQPPELRPKATF